LTTGRQQSLETAQRGGASRPENGGSLRNCSLTPISIADKALADFEAKRDVWQEVLDGVREIKAGGGKRTKVEAKSYVVRVRLRSGLS